MADLFQDKVAIVTGGASGLGLSLCEVLCRRGAYVIVADILCWLVSSGGCTGCLRLNCSSFGHKFMRDYHRRHRGHAEAPKEPN